jgi:hypothetical protein
VVISVDRSRDDGFPAAGSQAGHVSDGLRLGVRGPLPSGLVQSVAVAMGHVLAEHQGQVALIEDQGPVQQLTPAAAEPGGLGGRYRVLTVAKRVRNRLP